jgi:hypothetical protein
MALWALAACGEKKPNGSGTTMSVEDATAAEIARFQAEENARSRVTLIDAASGDGAAMPGEWTGPVAFDLRPDEEKEKKPIAKPAEPNAQAAAEPAAPEEEFPSVAQ